MGRTFASLKYFNYRVWFFSALVANTGLWMQRIAQNWLVLADLTNNNQFWVGLVTALQFLPTIFLMPLGGSLADRVDKRKLLILTQLAQLLLGVGLGLLVLFNLASIAWVCVFALLLGAVASIDNPPRLVFITELVPARYLPNAVGLNSMSFNLARLVGPGLAGLLIAEIGTGWVFMLTGAVFLVTMSALFILRADEYYPTGLAGKKPEKKVSTLQGIMDGVRYVNRRGDLMIIFFVVGLTSMLAMNTPLTTANMSRAVFGQNAGQFGAVGSIVAIGSFSGAVVSARVTKQPRVRAVVWACLGLGIATGLSAIAPTFIAYCVTVVPIGFFMVLALTSANTGIQMSVGPEVRGRVVSLYQTVLQGVTPLGSLLIGWVSQACGARWGTALGAFAAFLAVGVSYILGRSMWNLEIHYRIRHPFEVEILGPLEHHEVHAAGRGNDGTGTGTGAGHGDGAGMDTSRGSGQDGPDDAARPHPDDGSGGAASRS